MRFIFPIINRYVATGLQFVITLLVTNLLTLSEAGTYFLVYGAVTVTFVLSGIGMPDGLVKSEQALLANGDIRGASRMRSSVLFYGLVSLLPLSAALGLVALTTVDDLHQAAWIALWWFAAGVTYVVAQVLVSSGATALGTTIFYGGVNWCVFLTLIVAGEVAGAVDDLGDVLRWTALGALAAAALSVILLAREVRRGDMPLSAPWTFPWRVLSMGLPIAAGRLVQSAFIWSPVWLCGLLVSAESAALIGLASRLTAAIGAAIASIRFAVRPEIVRAAALGEWRSIEISGSRIAFWMTSLSLAALVGDLVVGERVINHVFGAAYGPSWVFVAIMVVANIAESTAGPADEVLKMTESGVKVLILQAAFLALSVVLELAGGLLGGAAGIAAGYAAGFTLLYLYLILWLRRRRGIVIAPRLIRT